MTKRRTWGTRKGCLIQLIQPGTSEPYNADTVPYKALLFHSVWIFPEILPLHRYASLYMVGTSNLDTKKWSSLQPQHGREMTHDGKSIVKSGGSR